MKKFLFLALALLSLVGVVHAQQIAVDPKDSSGAYITVPVYNNSGSALDAGDIVVWDIDASTGDDDLYVTTTTTSDTHIVAGIVWPGGIAAGDSGSVAIWGMVQCDVRAVTGVGENGPLCTSATAGDSDTCTNEAANFGFATVAGAGSQLDCFVKSR